MLGKIEGKRRRGQQGMRWLDNITEHSMNMNLSKLWETVEDRGAWHAVVPVDFRIFWCFLHSDDLCYSLDWTETNRTF